MPLPLPLHPGQHPCHMRIPPLLKLIDARSWRDGEVVTLLAQLLALAGATPELQQLVAELLQCVAALHDAMGLPADLMANAKLALSQAQLEEVAVSVGSERLQAGQLPAHATKPKSSVRGCSLVSLLCERR